MGTYLEAATSGPSHTHVLIQRAVAGGAIGDLAVVLLGCAAALFIVAGVIRLTRWRLAGDPHCALVGSALIVMGALYLPLVGIAEMSGALSHRDLAEAVLRALVTAITARLVLGSMRTTTLRGLNRPTRLLPLLALIVLAAFGALGCGELALSQPLPYGPEAARALSVATALGWLALAFVVSRNGSPQAWSSRAAPLFAALAVAEALYGQDPGAPIGTGVSLVVCTAVGAGAAWSAKADLDVALRQTERTIGSLSESLREVRDEAVGLTEWRAHLVHDATNAVAGLQAALAVLNTRQSNADARSANLCRAADEEARHLQHLLHRSPETPDGPFDVGAVATSVGLTARTLGHDVRLHAPPTLALGRAGEAAVVLKNLLANADRHAPGAPIDLSVEEVDGAVRIVCWDHGPGLDDRVAARAFERGFRGPASQGSGLGLYEARRLMRAQGGELVLDRNAPGARFVAILPAVPSPTARRTGGIPAQRRGSAGSDAIPVPEGALS